MKRIVTSLLFLGCLGGCYTQNKSELSEKTALFPIFSVNKSHAMHDNGQISRREEHGNMLVLASWTKKLEYDRDGLMTRRTENSVLFPVWATREEESLTHKKKQGSILFLINYNVKSKK